MHSSSVTRRSALLGTSSRGCVVAGLLALVAAGFADATWTLWPKHEWDVAGGAALVLAAGGEVWLPRGGHLLWNRARPRFRSFAAAGVGCRAMAERYC